LLSGKPSKLSSIVVVCEAAPVPGHAPDHDLVGVRRGRGHAGGEKQLRRKPPLSE